MRTFTSGDLVSSNGALFSECGAFRYGLWREWDASLPTLVYLMLNPSTADHLMVDHTIVRCVLRAIALGFGRIEVANMYALRATKPTALWKHADPVGPENDAYLARLFATHRDVVCAWGVHARAERVSTVLALTPSDVRLTCLGTTKGGAPRHPLYVRNQQPLIEYVRGVQPLNEHVQATQPLQWSH